MANCDEFVRKLPGGYKELILKDGLYKRMVELQAKSASWNLV